MTIKLSRLRRHENLRRLVRETELNAADFVYPLFIKQGLKEKYPITSMPGQYQLGLMHLEEEVHHITKLGIPAVLLFGIPAHKDQQGSSACDPDGIIPQAIRKIKSIAPDLLIISDICFCEYTDHGHCGIITTDNHIHHAATAALLAKQSIIHAEAGCDIIAPSGMIDGMVKTIREGLDNAGFQSVPILSYAVKFSSALYGPFREAAEGAPKFGSRAAHQMDPANQREALREVRQDVAEGTDMIIIKPAAYYLDIIRQTRDHFPEIPLAAYQVSGEYAMIKAAAEAGWLDEKKTVLESLIAIKRAGADFIITYFAKDAANWLHSGENSCNS